MGNIIYYGNKGEPKTHRDSERSRKTEDGRLMGTVTDVSDGVICRNLIDDLCSNTRVIFWSHIVLSPATMF